MSLLVNEIFFSIQGESTYSGLPSVFVRLTGCNLRCSYCDTQYAYDQGTDMKITEIMDQVASYKCSLVEITGGEPLMQQDTPLLIYNLCEAGYEVLMETNGSLDVGKIDKRCIKIVDIKCPSSGESDKIDFENLLKLDCQDQVKFVIGNRNDYEYAKKIMRLRCHGISGSNILFSPVSDKIAIDKLAGWILEDTLNIRLNIQLHKVIWPDKQRSV